MAYEKITEELIKETKEAVIVEHRKDDLEREKAAVMADKEKAITTADKRIAGINVMLAMFK